ncbi:lipase 3-like [Galleria mellonella]|uniref:Lipase n=1 Tax=Galleria mellonella TaxID=7137 RepID=A0A6J1WDL2_GALME|nr:lipase 3-like [Galleria mellonella]
MIIRSVLFVIFSEMLKVINGENCTLFERNAADIDNDVFEEIKDYADSGAFEALFNITAIESIYHEFKSIKYNEDIFLNITQLLHKYGYFAEQHEVQTSDGYLLNMFRIPNKGPVVFLMHGIFCSSDDYVTPGPDRGLAYLLADAGYDVWMGNARGTIHSRNHISLSPSCAEFWDFTWDEIGRYDLPIMIDYALNATNQEQLIYIGHSQGTTTFFVLCSERPEYNDKIRLMVALSAVSFLSHTKSLFFQIVSPINSLFWDATKAMNIYEFMPRNALMEFLTSTFCGTPATATIVCDNEVFFFAGPDFTQINSTALPVLFGHAPAGIATKQLIHYVQLIQSAKFGQFDHGWRNIEKYGSTIPPDYPVEKITSPVAVFYSRNDWFGDIEDVEILIKRLPNLFKFVTVQYESFSHMDYIWARDVKELLYVDVLNVIEECLNS